MRFLTKVSTVTAKAAPQEESQDGKKAKESRKVKDDTLKQPKANQGDKDRSAVADGVAKKLAGDNSLTTFLAKKMVLPMKELSRRQDVIVGKLRADKTLVSALMTKFKLDAVEADIAIVQVFNAILSAINNPIRQQNIKLARMVLRSLGVQ